MKTQDTYNVMIKLSLDIGLEIKAANLADALTKAQAWKINDIVNFQELGWDHNDSSMEITGVFKT